MSAASKPTLLLPGLRCIFPTLLCGFLCGCATMLYNGSENVPLTTDTPYLVGLDAYTNAGTDMPDQSLITLLMEATPLGYAAPALGYAHVQCHIRGKLDLHYPFDVSRRIMSVSGAVAKDYSFSLTAGSDCSGKWVAHVSFNGDIEDRLKTSGRVVKISPDGFDLSIACARGACSANGTPGIVSDNGDVHISSEEVVDKQRLKEIAQEEAVTEQMQREIASRTPQNVCGHNIHGFFLGRPLGDGNIYERGCFYDLADSIVFQRIDGGYLLMPFDPPGGYANLNPVFLKTGKNLREQQLVGGYARYDGNISYQTLTGFEREIPSFSLFDPDNDVRAAAAHGNIVKVRSLIADGASKEAALQAAAASGRIGIVRLLLKDGADVNVGNNEGVTPLMDAVAVGNLKMLSVLLGKNAGPPVDVNVEDKSGTTAFRLAVIHGSGDALGVAMANKLIQAGADVNQKDRDGQTALIDTAAGGSVAMLRFLLEHGAKVGIKNAEGFDAWDVANGRGEYFSSGQVLRAEKSRPRVVALLRKYARKEPGVLDSGR